MHTYRHPYDRSILIYRPYGPDSRIEVRPVAVYLGRTRAGWRASVTMPFRQYWWSAANKAHAQRLCERIARELAEVPQSEVVAYLDRLEV